MRLSALELGDVVDVCVDNVFAHPEGTGFGVRRLAEPERAVLLIDDRGPGFTPSREQRPGSSGEGLHIVRRLARQAGGSVQTSPAGEPGALARVSLPVADQP